MGEDLEKTENESKIGRFFLPKLGEGFISTYVNGRER